MFGIVFEKIESILLFMKDIINGERGPEGEEKVRVLMGFARDVRILVELFYKEEEYDWIYPEAASLERAIEEGKPWDAEDRIVMLRTGLDVLRKRKEREISMCLSFLKEGAFGEESDD